MRRLYFITAVALTACLDGDSSTGPAPVLRVAPSSEFELKYGQSAVISGPDMRLTFNAVEDSRCPTNALILCFWAGTGRVYLEVTLGAVELGVALNTNSEGGPVTAAVNGYELRLLDLLPVPETVDPIPPEAYRARLRVTPMLD